MRTTRLSALALLFALLAVGCSQNAAKPVTQPEPAPAAKGGPNKAQEPPLCDDIAKYHGQIVRYRGAFSGLGPTDVMNGDGYARVGGVIIVDWNMGGVSRDDARARFVGKQVEVTGRILRSTPDAYAPDKPQYMQNWIVGPHIIETQSVKLLAE